MTDEPRPGDGVTVALFATCINDTVRPEVAIAVVELLERLGCRVEFPQQQTCCGQMFTNTGYLDEAVPAVRTYVEAFGGYDMVVAPSGSCVGSVRHQHATVAERAGDAGLRRDVEQVSRCTYDLPELLVDILGVTDVGAVFPHRVTYHPTCHSLRMNRVGDRPLALLRAVRGIELVELPGAEECCGFGGTFAVKNPDVSVAMGRDKVANVAATRAQYVVAGDSSCLLHIGGLLTRERTAVTPIHLAQVLASTGGRA